MERSTRLWTALERWLMPSLAVVAIAAMLAGAGFARNWPLVHDAPLMHYVVFLMDHGRAPYRDIVEMNMPGTYLLESWGMHLLGGGARGWWMWDVLSGVLAVCGSAWIAGRGRRSAGVVAGALMYLFHLRGGPMDLGQRDWIVAVLLVVAFGFLFATIRSGRAAWMAGFMGFCGLAATIKPPVLGIGIFFLAWACWLVSHQNPAREVGRGRWLGLVLWSAGGGLVPLTVAAAFVVRWGVVPEFLAMMRGLVPWYAHLQRPGIRALLRLALVGQTAGLLVLGAVPIFFARREWRRWESAFLLAGAAGGLALFLIQGKGWAYHRFPEIAFAMLWAVLVLDAGLRTASRRARWQQVLAAATLLVAVLVETPHMLRRQRTAHYAEGTLRSLESDLGDLGGSRLSGKIQCLDMTRGGCITVLYRMGLVQSTGFLYDFYLFPEHGNAVTAPLQARFLRETAENPPEVIVLSAHTWPGDTFNYDQLDRWPVFAHVLREQYRLDRERPTVLPAAGYRIYVRNGQHPQ